MSRAPERTPTRSRPTGRASKNRVRADELLVRQGGATDLTAARALIMAGRVHAEGRRYTQAGQLVSPDLRLLVTETREYASRGAHKLLGALSEWPIDPTGRICLDVGASTGGFTDLLLRRGAERVYAVDVGYGQLAGRLRNDPRVLSMERTHICKLESLPEPPSLVTIDVSFIGLRQVLPCARKLVAPDADVIALVKPQFEAPPEQVDERGVVTSEAAQLQAVNGMLSWAVDHGWGHSGTLESPIAGRNGNREWFVWLRTP